MLAVGFRLIGLGEEHRVGRELLTHTGLNLS